MKRTKHSLSHYTLQTFDMGELVPVGHYEVLPGDSVRQATSMLLRVSPLMTPVMHPVTVRIHHWFVPYRIIWDGWEDFITGGPDGANADTPPTAVNTPSAGGITDYMGLPPGVTGLEWCTLPVRAYNLIWNEFYRDQDLQTERGIHETSVANVAWEKDYFTAARPWTQKGPDVTVPLGDVAPVKGLGTSPTTPWSAGTTYRETGGITRQYVSSDGVEPAIMAVEEDPLHPGFPAIYADLANATGVPINDFRLAFALQRYQEARAQYGSRYTEYLRYLGVRSSDARLQRPEYLGGGKSTISFSEILRTGNESTAQDSPIGEMKGHGIAALRTRRFIRFFEEHGIVLSLASVRPRTIYSDGVHRSWLRKTKEDYWQKELELIGQQEVYNAELRAQHANPLGVFGYQDRYSEYRHLPSYVAADFRSTLNDWHLARQFASDPALNASFVECVPSKRIHAEQTQDVLWCMTNHSIQARRLVGKRTIGRIV